MNLKIVLTAFFICINLFASAQNSISSIKEYKKIFTTYPFSDPDPIPKPDEKIYPFYRFDAFTDKSIQKEWKVVELENDFIKLMILPEIGGKIWSAVEKSTGKDFVYNNHVIKFRDIAMRGPWTSGGVEANYGIIGHTPNCATPVDYTSIKKDDGSVSCVIGAFDLLTRTSWRLDINLPKDKAYFTTSSFWFNSTSFNEPYYTWMNTGLKAGRNLQFIYPGKNYLGHNGEYSDWPISKINDKDISFYENNNFGGYKSYHVFGKYNDFFGAYYHNEDFGMGRYANHDDKPGKKIWIWGLSQQGLVWEKLLTDTDGQYVEVQSGRLFNQSSENSMYSPFKHRSFAPYQSDAWTEYWFPVLHTKGFIKANNYGALNIKNTNGWLKIYFSPLQSLNEILHVFEDGKNIYSKNIVVKPLQLFEDSIKISVDDNKLKVVLGDNKLVWNSAPDDGNLNRPLEIPANFDNNSVYGLYLQGKNFISLKDYQKAADKFTDCLKKDNNFSPALCGMAELYIRKFKYAEAVAIAAKALSIDTYDAAANFYYGLANERLGNIADAKDGFDIASASIDYRTAAYTELSRLYFNQKQHSKAIEYAEKSLVTNVNNIESLQLLALIYRLQNKPTIAIGYLNTINKLDPLNHFVDFENFLLDSNLQSKENFIAQIQNELPQQTFLELGIWYQQLHCNNEALKVFSLAARDAEIIFWQAYIKSQPVDVSHLETSQTFPFRYETAEVLRSLIKTNTHWLLKYHLGLIEWNRDNLSAAKNLLVQCGQQPNDPSFYAARAALIKEDTIAALADLQKAIILNKQGWRENKLLSEYFITQKQYAKALAVVAPFYKAHTANYVMGMLYAKTLLLTKNYAAADALLTQLQILPFEGATAGRQLYHEAKLMQAIAAMDLKQFKKALQFIDGAKLWPQNLGVGKPYAQDIDERLEDWLGYLCYTNLGNKVIAGAALQKIIAFTPQVDNTVLNFLPANSLISAWAIEKRESKKIAAEWLKNQAALYPDNKTMQWALQVYNSSEMSSSAIAASDGDSRMIEQLIKNKN